MANEITPASTNVTAFLDTSTGDLAQLLADLDSTASLNLVAMPELATMSGDAYKEAVAQIAEYCASRRAFFIVDPPADWTSVDAVVKGIGEVASIVKENGAVYWPLLKSGPVSPEVAKIYAAVDVWKAPAGIGAVLQGVEPAVLLRDTDNATLSPLAVNCIRSFPAYGTVVWGARTLAGADVLASQWKYVNVRRLALFIESSIIDSLQWTVFEPNAEPLWTSIRLTVTNFLTGLWRSGAFVGATSKDAFFVQCDTTTTTPDDIANGRLNVSVGFAAVQPAEFVVLTIALVALTPD